MSSKQDEEVRERSLRHMKNSAQWTRWPLQTVRRAVKPSAKNPLPYELGVLYAQQGAVNAPAPKVYLCNIFDFSFEAKSISYNSWEEVIAAGWLID